MDHPYPSLSDDPQAAVTILSTEHFNLQTARAATISESNGRTSIFLGAVSAGLVALALAGQASRTTLLTFGLVLLPVLSFLGLATSAGPRRQMRSRAFCGSTPTANPAGRPCSASSA
jgi:hypothetical protein